MRYWEDFAVGQTHTTDPVIMRQADIIRFAKKYDPQFFHTDPEAAKMGPFGKIAASGWHTASTGMRMMLQNLIRDVASQGAPGVKSLRWLKPVFPDDELTLTSEIMDTYPSGSRPKIGFVLAKHTMTRQGDEVVMTMENVFMVLKREHAA